MTDFHLSSQCNGIAKTYLMVRCISRVSDQNGVSLLYIMLEIHHSGQEPWISEMTARKSCKCSKYGSFGQLFLLSLSCSNYWVISCMAGTFTLEMTCKLLTKTFHTCHAYRQYLPLPFYTTCSSQTDLWLVTRVWESRNLRSNYLTKSSIDLNGIWCAVETCWSHEHRTHLISSAQSYSFDLICSMCKGESLVYKISWKKTWRFACIVHIHTSFFQT